MKLLGAGLEKVRGASYCLSAILASFYASWLPREVQYSEKGMCLFAILNCSRAITVITFHSYLIHERFIHVVRATNAQIYNIHFGHHCIVEGIQKPRCVRHLKHNHSSIEQLPKYFWYFHFARSLLVHLKPAFRTESRIRILRDLF